MTAKRVPVHRAARSRITPRAVRLFVEWRRARSRERSYALGGELHAELGLKPWQLPWLVPPGTPCPHPARSARGLWWPEAQRLWGELEAAANASGGGGPPREPMRRRVAAEPLDHAGVSLAAAAASRAAEIEAKDRANMRPVGRPKKKTVYGAKSDVHRSGRPCGNSAAAAMRRLRKDRPDIHARVLAGELSPHAGMIAAGFRKRREPAAESRPGV